MKSVCRWFAYLLLAANIVWTVHSYSNAPFVVPSVAASIGYVAALTLTGWLLLRRHPGVSATKSVWRLVMFLAFIWGVGLSGPAVYLNSQFSHILEYFRIDWLDAALYSPLNEEILKMMGVLLLCGGFLNLNRAIEAVPVGIAVGLGFAASEDPHFIIESALKNLNSDAMGALVGVVIRLAGCPFSHALYTGLVAFGVGLLFCRTGKKRSVAVWLLVGFGLHTFYNLIIALGSKFGMVSILLPGLIVSSWVLSVWLYLRSRKLASRNHEAAPEPCGNHSPRGTSSTASA